MHLVVLCCAVLCCAVLCCSAGSVVVSGSQTGGSGRGLICAVDDDTDARCWAWILLPMLCYAAWAAAA